jgi:UDP-glucose 6-dehydrogenase
MEALPFLAPGMEANAESALDPVVGGAKRENQEVTSFDPLAMERANVVNLGLAVANQAAQAAHSVQMVLLGRGMGWAPLALHRRLAEERLVAPQRGPLHAAGSLGWTTPP